ncbi:hypothetical protein SAMD00019534_093930 [Acytostelium subglobosum LB1]|uniref:hypothetical protein n=1 Tax=Acytostelium subglobosum LB1 TaxID=1410327 RepID=UPI0006451152|nr:hypothetical protein SAMD00019534_093930 [Acytostelium subglobosum LB1]GAM26218.1 hypothetical protein SAMD00019534_093930 [Acytostelium subglobosum LB1]|eukprot:XP_012750772.1 hypothetical protein SAMD00019534_093930 [Acytostelium subglobosum LB1]
MMTLDLFISDSEPYPSLSNHQARFYPLDDYNHILYTQGITGALPVAPWTNGTSKVLYINVFAPVGLICVFTSHVKTWKDPVLTSDRLSSIKRLYNGATLVYPDGSLQTTPYTIPETQRSGPFMHTYPTMDPTPFSPMPTTLLNDQYLNQLYPSKSLGQINIPLIPFKPNSFQSNFLLSKQVNDYRVLIRDFDSLSKTKLKFSGVIIDIDGVPLDDTVELKVPSQTACNYTQFEAILAQIKQYQLNLSLTNDTVELMELRYNMDTLSFTEAWQYCVNQSSNYMTLHNKNVTMTTNSCPNTYSNPNDYLTDSCCNKYAKFSQCCQPREVTVTVSSLTGFQTGQLDRCSSPACAQSVLQDYFTSSSRVANGECTLSFKDYNKGQYEMVQLLQRCKDLVYTRIWCDNDTQCPANTICSIYTRQCQVPLEQQDRAYIMCVLNGSSISTLYNLQQQLGVANSNSKTNTSSSPSSLMLLDQSLPDLVDLVYNTYRMDDCTSFMSNDYRTQFDILSTFFLQSYIARPLCLDSYCPLIHVIGSDYDILRVRKARQIPLTSCSGLGVCANASTCLGQDNCYQCKDMSFCGHCATNQTMCHVLREFNSTQCPTNTSICMTQNGNYDRWATPEQCDERGTCTTNCGYMCYGSTYCYAPNLNRSSCISPNIFSNGMCWINSTNRTKEYCTGSGYLWMDCEQLTLGECSGTLGRSQCWVMPRPCTKDQCATVGGTCSDWPYFANQTDQGRVRDGVCVRSHTVFIEPLKQPACTVGEIDSPMGCFDQWNIVSKAQCHAKGPTYRWWPVSINQSICESYMGCQMTDYSNTTSGQVRFNEMTQEQCTQCQSTGDNYMWTKMFKWTPGRWLPGIMVKPTWYQSLSFSPTTKYGDSFSLDGFGSALSNIMKYDLLRSSCQFQSIQDSVDAVSCSCSGGGGRECFQSTSAPTQSLLACATESKKYQVINGYIQLYADSVNQSCTLFEATEVSREIYASPPSRVPLSAEFFSYLSSTKYGITNSEGAFIGLVQSNGVSIQGTSINRLTLCQLLSPTTGQYPVNDMAMRVDNSSSSILVPMNAEQITGDDGQIYMCVNLTLPLLMRGVDGVALFPVIRAANSDSNKEFFTRSQRVLMYILAVIYALCAAWGLFQIGVIIVKLVRRIEGPKLAHALIGSITCYTFIRAIYFFILPSGALYTSRVSDYVLVILPTFIYFTCFSFILALWYIIVSPNLLQDYTKRLSRTIIVLNGVLYIACVTIILVYNATESTSSLSFCGSRALAKVSNSRAQTIISILYGVLQALISLVYGIMFIYLGIKINKLLGPLKVARNADGSVLGISGRKIQLFLVTASCSSGLILHSIFVLVLITTQTANNAFSFVFLLLTEVFPAITMYVFYNQSRMSSPQNSVASTSATGSSSSKMKVLK